MSERHVIIYAARNTQQAYMLKDRLADAGIESMLVNEATAGGLGLDAIGWPALTRVMVAEENAPLARQMALEFDRSLAQPVQPEPDEPVDEQAWEKRPKNWPQCPKCDALRLTACPVCKTTGTEFALADDQFVGDVIRADSAPQEACGPEGCSRRAPGVVCDHSATGRGVLKSRRQDPPASTSSPMVLICPTCDEPFVPEFPRRCAMCGHEFADGVEVEFGEPFQERLPPAAIAVMLALVAIIAALAIYFLVIL